MKDLKLPVIKHIERTPRVLSMDEYFAVVRFHLENTVDRDACRKEKKRGAVADSFTMTSIDRR